MAGRGAVLGAAAAAWWHGLLPTAPPVADVTVPTARKPGRRPGVRCRRRDLARRDLVGIRGVELTDVPLTVLEAAVVLGADGPALLDRVLQQRRAAFGALVRAHHRGAGREGSPAVGRLLAAAADGAASRAERVLVRLLRDAGIAGWVLGLHVGGAVLDLAFPAARVAVEVDGWAWHSDVDRFVRDRRRQNGVTLAGWTVLRFTWHDLTSDPERVVREILAALGR